LLIIDQINGILGLCTRGRELSWQADRRISIFLWAVTSEVSKPLERRKALQTGARSTSPGQQAGGSVRWSIGALLFTGVLIHYFDRVNRSVAVQPLAHEFHLSPVEFGILLSAFGWSYLVLQIPVGTLLDQIGVNWLMRISVILWSVVSFLTAIIGGLGGY
jgi:sugar phosphate permease